MKYSITLGMLLLTMITAKSQTLAERVNAKNATLIDVRTPEEFAKGTAEGAINIPLEEIGARWQELRGKENVVLFCRRGIRAGKAQDILKKHNITAVNGKTVEHIKSLQKVNLADKLTFRNDKQTTYFVKDGQNVRQVAIALGEGAVLKKHTTNIPATLIMVKGTVRFLINGEEVVLKDLDTYQIPVDVEHEVIGVEKENIFIVTKGN
ncbi:rhodanese-like domain-containing protein [Capnocytophaga genosp. AHN8471]|uniref:rhodanese-like domain-containing protein n=1 Tax=Capnocytophaga genosp. AHN8471 TaxID=327574 RepID=UPI0019323633|nr:rhodanese-like domain-containing protein [Capnocytophaga genosp. AHN8471]MBM0658883.1 rhodanese [Capnocytophaga genosp. AHN8471]